LASRSRTQPRRIPHQERAKNTVEALLSATAQVLKRDGYDRASTNLIAARAGVNIASLYQYYPSKEALVAALIDQQLERLTAWMVPTLEEVKSLPLAEAVERVVRRYQEGFLDDVALHQVLLRQVPRVERWNPVVELRRALIEQLAGHLAQRRDVRVKDPATAAFAVIHASEALGEAAVLERPELLGDAAYVRRVAAALVALVRAR
jgi:AcrR family transcriptional regulator